MRNARVPIRFKELLSAAVRAISVGIYDRVIEVPCKFAQKNDAKDYQKHYKYDGNKLHFVEKYLFYISKKHVQFYVKNDSTRRSRSKELGIVSNKLISK